MFVWGCVCNVCQTSAHTHALGSHTGSSSDTRTVVRRSCFSFHSFKDEAAVTRARGTTTNRAVSPAFPTFWWIFIFIYLVMYFIIVEGKLRSAGMKFIPRNILRKLHIFESTVRFRCVMTHVHPWTPHASNIIMMSCFHGLLTALTLFGTFHPMWNSVNEQFYLNPWKLKNCSAHRECDYCLVRLHLSLL